MIDIYRPLTVMLDAIEFAAKQALKPKSPAPWTPHSSDGLEALSRMDLIKQAAPHLRGEVTRSASSPTIECGARCQCGARFSLIPLCESELLRSREPGRMLAGWLIDGLLSHRCEVYP